LRHCLTSFAALDSSDELVDPSAAFLSHPKKYIDYITDATFHIEPDKETWEREGGILQFLPVE